MYINTSSNVATGKISGMVWLYFYLSSGSGASPFGFFRVRILPAFEPASTGVEGRQLCVYTNVCSPEWNFCGVTETHGQRLKGKPPDATLCLALYVDPPLAVEDFSCISENWSSLNCTWREQYNPIRNVSPVKTNKITKLLHLYITYIKIEIPPFKIQCVAGCWTHSYIQNILLFY